LLVVGWLLLERGGCDAGETLVSVEGEGRRGISVLIGGGHGEDAGPRPDEELVGVVGSRISHQYVVGRHGSLWSQRLQRMQWLGGALLCNSEWHRLCFRSVSVSID